MPNSVEICKQF